MAAWSWYGPTRPEASVRAISTRPSSMRSASQRSRSWSSRSTRRPASSTLASRRASCRRVSASSPAASGSSGSSETTSRARRIASPLSSRRIERVARRRRVALVEHEVEDPQHAVEALRQQLAGRHPVRDAGVADLALGPDEALRERRLWDEERAGDLGRRQAAERPQRQRDPTLQRQRRVTAREDQAKAIVGDRHVVVGSDVRLDGRQVRLDHGVARELLGLVTQPAAPAEPVDRPVAGGRRDPRAGVVRDAPLGPDLQGGDERVLDRLLGEVEVAEDADERRDRPSLLLPEQAVDELVGGLGGDAQFVDAAPTGGDASACVKSMIGRTSIDPKRIPGHSSPYRSAASRSGASMR